MGVRWSARRLALVVVCGVVLCLGVVAAVLIWHHVLWEWLNSPAGLLFLGLLALICQLAGVWLVVADLRHYNRNLRLLVRSQSVIHASYEAAASDHSASWQQQENQWLRQAAEVKGPEQVTSGLSDMVKGLAELGRTLDLLSGQVLRAEALVKALASHALEIRDPKLPWLGPVLLLAGVGCGSAASLLAI